MSKKLNLIGYCGRYCGDCTGYTQTVANLATAFIRIKPTGGGLAY